jgi:hypothetical protein
MWLSENRCLLQYLSANKRNYSNNCIRQDFFSHSIKILKKNLFTLNFFPRQQEFK